MSDVQNELQSTPSSHRLSAKNQAGNLNYKQEEIKQEIELDLRNAVKCKFDDLLKYFLYLALGENSEEKQRLDELQAQIEEKQSARYYKKENGVAGGTTTAPEIPEKARQEEAVDDYADATSDEMKLVKERNEKLEALLDQTIDEVLPIANDKESLRPLLVKFQTTLQAKETDRYGPYVKLCNTALDRLSGVAAELPFRGPDKLDIRFQVNDPSDITSKFEGAPGDVNRRPDICISSKAALSKFHACQEGDFTSKPPSRLRWTTVLSCIEFKVYNQNYPHGTIRSNLEDYKYKKDLKANDTKHKELPKMDVVTVEVEETAEGTRTPSTSKRSHDIASLEGSEVQPPKKRRTPGTTPSGSKAHSRASSPTKPIPVEKKTQKAVEGRVQCASYALEMLSYSAGVHHAINLLFTDGIMWVWYYDRQGIIQSSGISIIEDFPRFLVLLLAFQRFSVTDWGIIPPFNPESLREHNFYGAQQQQQTKKKGQKAAAPEDSALPVELDLREDLVNFKDSTKFWKARGDTRVIDLLSVELNMNDFLSNRPHCLAGRATAVVPATGRGGANKTMPMVCKVYHPEVQRRHEGLTMQVIYEIARDDERKARRDEERANLDKWDMFKHLPTFYFHGDVKSTATQRVRSMVHRRWKGHRTMRIIGMKELKRVTTISGWQFVKAWLEGVICHSFLWKNFVEHGDPTVSNLMYDEENDCGVLTDFDLSLLQWEPRVFGTDRTGTVPFMALDLLTDKYWTGKIKRFYHHELESFVWTLPYVFLLYQDGKRQRNPLIDSWRTSAYDMCAKEKTHFYLRELGNAAGTVQDDFRYCWWLANDLCKVLRDHHIFVQDRLDSASRGRVNHKESKPDYIRDSEDLRDMFYDQLKRNLTEEDDPEFPALLDRFDYYKPGFELSDDEAQYLHNHYSRILGSA